MPRTRSTTSIEAVDRKRKKPDHHDDASLSSSGSFDSQITKKAIIIRKKSPRKRPSRKRERLEELPLVVIETKTLPEANKLTPKKRSLKEVQDDNVYQLEVARKKKTESLNDTGKRTKVSVAASLVTGLVENPMVHPAPPVCAPLAEEKNASYLLDSEKEAEQQQQAEELALPYAVSASTDEVDDAPLPPSQALVTPQQQHHDIKDDGVADNHKEDEPAETDHLPAHVTTEKKQESLQEKDEHKSVQDDNEEDQQDDNNDEVILPRSLLQTLEQDQNSAAAAVAARNNPTLANTENAEKRIQTKRSNKTTIADRLKAAEASSFQSSIIIRKQQTTVVLPQQQESQASPVVSHNEVETANKHHDQTLRAAAKAVALVTTVSKVPTTTSTTSTAKTRVVSPSVMEALDHHHQQQPSKATAAAKKQPKKKQSILLIFFLVLFKMIALAEIIAIVGLYYDDVPTLSAQSSYFKRSLPTSWNELIMVGSIISPQESSSPPSTKNNASHLGGALGKRSISKPRTDNVFEPWWKKNNNNQQAAASYKADQAVVDNHASTVNDSNNQWLLIWVQQVQENVVFVLETLLQDGREVVAVTFPMWFQNAREIMATTTVQHDSDEATNTTLAVLLHDCHKMLEISRHTLYGYLQEGLVVLENVGIMAMDLIHKIREYSRSVMVMELESLLQEFLVKTFPPNEAVIAPNTSKEEPKTPKANVVPPSVESHQYYSEIMESSSSSVNQQQQPRMEEIEIPEEPTTTEQVLVVEVANSSVEETESIIEDHETLLHDLQEQHLQHNERVQTMNQEPVESIEEELLSTDEWNSDETINDVSEEVVYYEETKEWHDKDSSLGNIEGADPEYHEEEEEVMMEPKAGEVVTEIYSGRITLGAEHLEENEIRTDFHQNIDPVEHQEEESESQAAAMDQTPEEEGHETIAESYQESQDTLSIVKSQSVESEIQVEAIDQTAIEAEATQIMEADIDLEQESSDVQPSKKQVRFSDDVKEIGKEDLDEASLTDTTIDSEEHSFDLGEMEEALMEIPEGNEPNVQPVSPEKTSSSFPPALLSMVAILNSTVSKQNALISERLAAAKSLLVKKDSAGEQKKRGFRTHISSFVSKFKAIIGEKKTVLSKRLENSKLFGPQKIKAQKRLPKRISSFLSKVKSSLGAQVSAITKRLKKLLPFNKTERKSKGTPVQLREPVGAPILHKHRISMEANRENMAVLNKARKKDSKHPGVVGRELLRKVRPAIDKSRKTVTHWLQQRFRCLKSFLRQETIEESVL